MQHKSIRYTEVSVHPTNVLRQSCKEHTILNRLYQLTEPTLGIWKFTSVYILELRRLKLIHVNIVCNSKTSLKDIRNYVCPNSPFHRFDRTSWRSDFQLSL